MAGRGGRGRGRGKGISFNVETLGFGRGEALPTPILQPPPVYPIAQFKPVPLETSEENSYLLALKEELHNAMKESVYVIKPAEKKREIERYSDKYQSSLQEQEWQPDWDRLPAELQPKRKRKVKPGVSLKRTKLILDEINEQFELLAEREGTAGEQEGEEGEDADEEKKDKPEDEEEEGELEIDEEELEEETDYNLTYFDNGENDDDDDDVDEGPVY